MLYIALLFAYVVSKEINLADHQRLTHTKFYLGRRRSLHGYAFVHYHQHHEPQHHLHRKRDVAACTAPISSGTKWRVGAAGFNLYTHNKQNLSPSYIERAITRGLATWNCALGSLGMQVLGPITERIDANDVPSLDLSRPTGENAIEFGTITGLPGTVAITVVWGQFEGPVAQRFIAEFKMRFDQSHYRFGNASESAAVMDLEAIATHELGHALGLDDIYDRRCADVTMFGTSKHGEVNKRHIANEDTKGLFSLYKH